MKKLPKKAAFLGVTLSAMAALVVSLSPAASAANYDGVCDSGEVCLWEHMDYHGAFADFYYDNSDYAPWYYWSAFVPLNDTVSSLQNHAIWYDVQECQDANYGGGWVRYWPGQNVAFVGATWNDMFSSHRFI